MHKMIWKYKLMLSTDSIGKPQQQQLAADAEVLSVGEQEGEGLVLWAMHRHQTLDANMRTFIVAFTGQAFELPKAHTLIGTVQLSNGLVCHVFEVSA